MLSITLLQKTLYKQVCKNLSTAEMGLYFESCDEEPLISYRTSLPFCEDAVDMPLHEYLHDLGSPPDTQMIEFNFSIDKCKKNKERHKENMLNCVNLINADANESCKVCFYKDQWKGRYCKIIRFGDVKEWIEDMCDYPER